MGSKQENELGFNPIKKVSRLSLAPRGPLSTKEAPTNPQGMQNPSLEECKPILGDRLGCGWGWASRRTFGASLSPTDAGSGTPPQPDITVGSTQMTWNNVSTSGDYHESGPPCQSVEKSSPPSDNQIPSNSGCQGTSPKAPELGKSSPNPQGRTATMLRRKPGVATSSTDKALVVLTDLRHDPLYGKMLADLQRDNRRDSRERTKLGYSFGSLADSPGTQWSSRWSTACPRSESQENIRTSQQPGSEVSDLTSAVHPAKRSRKALEETGMSPEVSQMAIPSLLNADANKGRTGGAGNPMRDNCAGPDLLVKSSNISPLGDVSGITATSTREGTQQSPILGRGPGRRANRINRAGELYEPNGFNRVNPPNYDSDSDAEAEGGVAQQSASPVPPPRNFRMGNRDLSLTPPSRSCTTLDECTSSTKHFGLLEAFEMGRRNMN